MILRKKMLSLSVALVAPMALAVSSSRQDYVDAMRAVPDAVRGARLFATCAACHGADGGGAADGSVPRIAGQYRQVITKQIVDYRYARRGDPRMEFIADRHLLKDAQAIGDVSQFVASLQAMAPAGVGRGDRLELGRQIYLGRCGSCHGSSGDGDARAAAPRLAGQHYVYLLRQLHEALGGGRPQLSSTHNHLLKDLDRDGLQGLADMLSRADTVNREARR